MIYTFKYVCVCVAFIKRPSETPVTEQVEFILLTYCSKKGCTPWGSEVGGGSEGSISERECEKEPITEFGLWVGNSGASLRKFVLDWVLSESGDNIMTEYLKKCYLQGGQIEQR